MKRLTGQLPDEEVKKILRIFPSVNVGNENLTVAALALYGSTLRNMADWYTPEELSAIVQAMNGGTNHRTPGKTLFPAVEQYIESVEGWTRDEKRGLYRKLEALTPWESYCLELWGAAYWRKRGSNYERRGIPRYCQDFIDNKPF